MITPAYSATASERDDRLLMHEREHLPQIEREDRRPFALKYSWRTIRYGYWHNHYDVEARASESKTT